MDGFVQDKLELNVVNEPNEEVDTYFLPELTEDEMKLVEMKDPSYLETFLDGEADVDEDEMLMSESKSKYVRGSGHRRTMTIVNESMNIKKRKKMIKK